MQDFINRPTVNPAPNASPIKINRPSKWSRMSHKKKVVIISLMFVLGLVVIGLVIFIFTRPPAAMNVAVTPPAKEEPITKESLINGVLVDSAVANRHPVAVMIENSQAARPQVGLTSADVVYEAVTEGGITRYMAVFSQKFPDKAGPVRSARSYFIDYLSEYDAYYAHAGGSPTALSRISEFGIKDYPDSNDVYHREPAPGVASEHTLFVDVSKLFQFGQSKKHWPATYETQRWAFKDSTAGLDPTALKTVSINFSTAPFKVDWKFDPVKNTYNRELAGAAHKDRTSGEQVSAKTVITMRVSHSPNLPYKSGKESEWAMTTTGEGEANVFTDGNVTTGKWKKASRTDRTRFYDATGKEIPLNRGRIWVEIIPQDGSVSQT